jgi:hypothetical protein
MVDTLSDAGFSRPIRLLWLIDSLTMGGGQALVLTFARSMENKCVRLTVRFLKTIGVNPLETELRTMGVTCVNLETRNRGISVLLSVLSK